MQPQALADLHALCFSTPRPWRMHEFAALLKTPGIFLINHPHGFALGRIAGPEAELLTIAVQPEAQNKGHGARLINDFLAEAALRGADEVFLEVSKANLAAIALYRRAGFVQVAERKGYFKQINGPALTALIFKYTI